MNRASVPSVPKRVESVPTYTAKKVCLYSPPYKGGSRHALILINQSKKPEASVPIPPRVHRRLFVMPNKGKRVLRKMRLQRVQVEKVSLADDKAIIDFNDGSAASVSTSVHLFNRLTEIRRRASMHDVTCRDYGRGWVVAEVFPPSDEWERPDINTL